MALRDDASGFSSFTGSLDVMIPVGTWAKERGSARSARLTVVPDRVSVVPFGIWRGIFREKVVVKSDAITVFPVTSPLAGRSGILIDGNIGGDGVAQEIYFYPRTASEAGVLMGLTNLGYQVDLTQRKPRIFG